MTTDDHLMEIYYDTEWYAPPTELKPSLKNQAQRFPARGVNVRRLDHVNLLASEVAALRHFMEQVVGMRTTEMIVLDNGQEAGAWVTTTNKTYDLAFTADHYGARGPLPSRHLRRRLPRGGALRAADIFLENGVHIETGPHKHAIQQTFFLYVYEPGGNRVEVDNAGARLMLAPDWQPIVWTRSRAQEGSGAGDSRRSRASTPTARRRSSSTPVLAASNPGAARTSPLSTQHP